uniref:Photosystem II reaction center protein Z n=1 Tax=Phacus pleuronectes TaxID=102908 RepID=A0A3G3LLW3_9EUGL|nr:photosystem II protein Z [Phacus pleuronectes]AYQ93702.1 photosystem II protein Z [Phacus pleuronectes]
MNLIFQSALLGLIFFSILLVVSVPVILASVNGWNDNKSYILFSVVIWIIVVIVISILSFFII